MAAPPFEEDIPSDPVTPVYQDAVPTPTSIGADGLLSPLRRIQMCDTEPRRPQACIAIPRRLSACGTGTTSEYAVVLRASWRRRYKVTWTYCLDLCDCWWSEQPLIYNGWSPLHDPYYPNLFIYGFRSTGGVAYPDAATQPMQIGRHARVDNVADFYTSSTGEVVSYLNVPGTVVTFTKNIDSARPYADGYDAWLGGEIVGYPEYKTNYTVNGVTYAAVLVFACWYDLFKPTPCCGFEYDFNTECCFDPEASERLSDCVFYSTLPACFRGADPVDLGGICPGTGEDVGGAPVYWGTATLGGLGGGAGGLSPYYASHGTYGYAAAFLCFDTPLSSPFDGTLPVPVAGFLQVQSGAGGSLGLGPYRWISAAKYSVELSDLSPEAWFDSAVSTNRMLGGGTPGAYQWLTSASYSMYDNHTAWAGWSNDDEACDLGGPLFAPCNFIDPSYGTSGSADNGSLQTDLYLHMIEATVIPVTP